MIHLGYDCRVSTTVRLTDVGGLYLLTNIYSYIIIHIKYTIINHKTNIDTAYLRRLPEIHNWNVQLVEKALARGRTDHFSSISFCDRELWPTPLTLEFDLSRCVSVANVCVKLVQKLLPRHTDIDTHTHGTDCSTWTILKCSVKITDECLEIST